MWYNEPVPGHGRKGRQSVRAMKKLLWQIVKFGGVGALCFLIDYGLLCLLTDCGGMHSVAAAAVSFSVSVIINYLLSAHFVFDTRQSAHKARSFALFVVCSGIGLGLTVGIMKLGVDIWGLNYKLVKVAATGIVMVYNFVSRKLFMER